MKLLRILPVALALVFYIGVTANGKVDELLANMLAKGEASSVLFSATHKYKSNPRITVSFTINGKSQAISPALASTAILPHTDISLNTIFSPGENSLTTYYTDFNLKKNQVEGLTQIKFNLSEKKAFLMYKDASRDNWISGKTNVVY